MNETQEELEINLSEIFALLKKKWRLVVSITLLGMIIATVVTTFFISKKYESTARVLPKPEVTDGLVDNSQLMASTNMVNNYVELMKGSTVLDQVAANLNIKEDVVYNALSVSNETGTHIITVTAKTTNPELSKKIVDETLQIFYTEVKDKLKISNIATIDNAKIATSPASPSLKMNLVIGALLGIFVSCGYIFVQFMLDTHVHSKEEAEKYFGLPVLGVVPDFEN